jgi:hypothetical protein
MCRPARLPSGFHLIEIRLFPVACSGKKSKFDINPQQSESAVFQTLGAEAKFSNTLQQLVAAKRQLRSAGLQGQKS